MLNGGSYSRIIDGKFLWNEWSAPKTSDVTLVYNTALTGNDLRNFVNHRLLTHLASFKQTTENSKSINYKIGVIFSELRNKLQIGYALYEVSNKVDEIKFLGNTERHKVSGLYEYKINNMGNAGRVVAGVDGLATPT